MSPSSNQASQSSPTPTSQHFAQLLWTGVVAVVLGIVALQQATDPGDDKFFASTGPLDAAITLRNTPSTDAAELDFGLIPSQRGLAGSLLKPNP